MNLLIYKHRSAGILTGISHSSEIVWGNIDILIILSLPKQEHSVFPHLFRSLLISFSKTLYSLMYMSCTSFASFIPKYILCLWYCKWCFKILFYNCSSLVCRNIIDFSMLRLCPTTLVNSLIWQCFSDSIRFSTKVIMSSVDKQLYFASLSFIFPSLLHFYCTFWSQQQMWHSGGENGHPCLFF